MYENTDDLRVRSIEALTPPAQILAAFPLTPGARHVVAESRTAVHRILHGTDERLIVIIGPCSIHDVAAAKEYGARLLDAARRLANDLLILMRVYFEKPRTTGGWKGRSNDPGLDGSVRINDGLRLARGLLRDLNETGLPVACEFLDMVTPQYIADLVSWGAIGARTTESQIHRELASGLSCPIGFKNGTDGNVRIAVDGVRAAAVPHRFIGVTKTGACAIVSTAGNSDCHIVLRGGTKPNYDAESVAAACTLLEASALRPAVMIDLSHANSSKQFERQIDAGHDVARQIAAGERRIMGVMAESHLRAGRQDLVPGKPLVYGQSITDGCLGWDESERLLEALAAAVAKRRLTRS
ncbi:MAG: 3-deoxy-7-phosphoheptulonate synthase [Betaproteobacteria bacterium]